MRRFLSRWKRSPSTTQSAAGATTQGPITLIQGVRGDVTVVAAPQPTPAGAPEIETARARYAIRLRQRYGRLDLEVLTPLREQGEDPVVHLGDVFVPQSVRADPPPVELPQELLRRLMEPAEAELLDLPPGIDRKTVERVRRAYQERPPQDVLDVLAAPEHDRVVILGHPGSGKSTLARYLTLALTAPEPRPGLEALHGRLPLIVELRSYAQAAWRERGFEDFLAHQYATEGLGLPPDMLTAFLDGRGPYSALVIFDGLDELFERDVRDAVARRIAGFAARHPQARIVVTSRGYGYQRTVLDGAGFTNFMLQDLDREQIGAFVERWFAVACHDGPGVPRLIERVTSAVDSSSSVRELAGNPLILTILAIIGRRRELPRDRRTVYEHAVDVLVEHWDPSKYLKDRQVEEHLPYLAAEDKRELLRLIARQMQEGHGGISGNHIAGPDLLKSFEEYLKDRYALPPDRAATAARVMLDQFRHRNFILSRFGGEIYGFVHRTFLEYLTATDLAHRFNYRREISEADLQDLFATKVHDPAWHEVLLLLVGLLHERFVAGVIDRLLAPRDVRVPLQQRGDKAFTEVAFVARSLAEVRRLGALAPQSVAMVREVIRLLTLSDALGVSSFNPWQNVASLGPSFAALGPHWEGRDVYLSWQAARHDSAGTRRLRYLPANSAEHLMVDITLFLRGGEETSRTEELVSLATRSASPVVRIAAVRHLLSRLGDDPAVWDCVRRRLREEENHTVRVEILEHMRNVRHGDAETRTFLALDRLAHDDSADVRCAAVDSLPHQRLDVHDVRAGLDSALRDPDPGVRYRAVHWLVGNKEDPAEAAAALRTALADADPGTRAAALDAVDEVGGRDPGVRGLLFDSVWNEEIPHVTAAGVRALRHVRADDPTVRTLLHELCGHKESEVRTAAMGCLADRGDTGGESFDLIVERMRNDEVEGVRAAAVGALGRRLRFGEPALRDLLLERAGRDPSGDVQLRALRYLSEIADGEACDALRHRAEHDADDLVRWTACHLLLAGYGDDPVAVRQVLARAAEDDYVTVRAGALRELGRRRGDRTEVLDLARDRLAHDPDPDVRRDALRILADVRRDDPEFLALLRREAGTATADVRVFAERLLAVLDPQPS
ncbi:HEAT repeat domain-containing protein [Streptomyces sp. NPDC058326]|uniref:HEAT repeat domain-containing protein n=1 Tax=Streptomyces sp. NPDC058326 TaxID=3346447 RepID=UPI0036E3D356